jgi:peptidoglycan/xylan/chitin deacetylase (PgdA/CDA1 family)
MLIENRLIRDAVSKIKGDASNFVYGPRKPYRTNNVEKVFSDSMDDLTKWATTGRATVSLDSTNYVASVATTRSSISLTPKDNSQAGLETDYLNISSFDATNGVIKIRIKILDSTALTTNDIWLGSGSDWSNYNQYRIWPSDGVPDEDIWWIYYIQVRKPSAEIGDVDLSEITRIRVSPKVTAGSFPVIVVDQIEIYGGEHGVVETNPSVIGYGKHCITFDDADEDLYSMAAYLTAVGLRATFYVITNRVGNAGQLTVDQLKEMHKAGHLIASHTHNHVTVSGGSTNGDLDFVTNDIRLSQQWLCANGFSDGADYMALPFGSSFWNANGVSVDHDIAGNLMAQVRDTGSSGLAVVDALVNPWYTDASIGDNANIATSAMNDAISRNGISIVYFHSYSTTPQKDFENHANSVVEAVEAGNIECVTMAELL